MVITHNMKNKKLLLGIAWAWLICLSANAEASCHAAPSEVDEDASGTTRHEL